MTQQQQQQQQVITTTGTTTKWKPFVFGLIVGILVSNMEKCVEKIASIGPPSSSSSSLQWQQVVVTTDDDNDDNIMIKAKAAAAAAAVSSNTKSLLLDNNINNGNNDDYHNSNNIHLASLKQIQKPAKCGVVFFYHNGGTGGSSFNHYLLNYRDLGYEYFTAWGSGDQIKAKFIDGTTKHIQNLTLQSSKNCTGRQNKLSRAKRKRNKRNNITTPKPPPPPIVNCQSWKTIHSHHMSGGMNDTLEYFQQWKYDVEQVQGCKFLLVTIARDPLDHFLAKFRYMKSNYTMEFFINRTRSQQYLEYFMYNWIRNGGVKAHRIPYIEYPNTTEKVRKALEIVDNYYDIIVMDSNVTKLEYAVGEWTGWPKNPSIRTNSAKAKVRFTKNEIKEIRSILDKDGDTEFYRQLKLRQASDDYPNVI